MADPSTDPQDQAFRGAGPEDLWDGDLLVLREFHAVTQAHSPITDPGQLRGPNDYEQGRGWDQSRSTPKTLAEAQESLAERISDPSAPDTAAHAAAYDSWAG